jgi:hypothetical protein
VAVKAKPNAQPSRRFLKVLLTFRRDHFPGPKGDGFTLEIKEMKCPVCGCVNFFVKDPDDEYETYEFELQNGEICYDPGDDDAAAPELQDDTETFCDKCAWHGKLKELKSTK